ncbi:MULTISPECIES: L,D-transpeptidase [unclassified Lentilitoribacter]|jgi:lipoprotein-anchoring transpeptidase ErfK/SrfK|uniref:L,D-transpeptidase n=1 Tax=unclassified Lentilitoribacter TaxID=2647570 RepID=UPI0013A6CD20|nr:L,D-transpeptidase [Lentilitoribacter sp. Alg239-R112]
MQFRQSFQILILIFLGALAGCASNTEPTTPKTYEIFSDSYGSVKDGDYKLPAIPVKRINKKYHRQIVKFYSSYPRGTIVVNTPQRYLYYVLGGGKAVRYGISVGREGFAWEGEAYIAVKREWPKWFPPEEMADRQPHLRKYVKKGMNPGLKNPLGARALYLHDSKTREDTLFRLHGTPQWSSIGTAASSGCIRLINQDIIDLFDRVKPGRLAKVIVIQ